MKVSLFDKKIYLVKLNKITIYIDDEVFAFLSEKTNEEIKIKTNIGFILKRKFKIFCWDDYINNIPHLKFLVKYSPILSKFIDLTEFDTIELISSSNRIINDWGNVSYINFNDGKEFFNINDISYGEQDTISIKIDSEFLKILEGK